MIDAIQACSYDKASKEGVPAEDVAEFSGDDPYDDLRYACDSAEQYFNEAGREFERIQKQAALTEALKNTGNWTAYYRNMRTIEANQANGMQVVRRFHRRRR
jgi:dTDP-D-glucose 4,6-dehydratase